MSTSNQIANVLGITQVPLDWNYCEWIADFLYTSNPVPHIAVRNNDMATLKVEKGWTNVDFTDNEEGFNMGNALFPETKDLARSRLDANI